MRPKPLYLSALFPLICCLSAAPLWADNSELISKEGSTDKKAAGGSGWGAAAVGATFNTEDKVRTGEDSRAVVRLSDKSELRLDELTEATIEPGKSAEVNSGGGYFFSREKAEQLRIRTPAVNGALRGTQLVVRVGAGGRTTMTLLEGELYLTNAAGKLLLKSGEQAEIMPGSAPRKTAVIMAADVPGLVQWALYYPAVLQAAEFGFSANEERALAGSLEAYRAGDLLGALAKLPRGYSPGSISGRLYRAAVLLSVGRVDKGTVALRGVSAANPGRRALEQLIAAVTHKEWTAAAGGDSAARCIAESYWQQSKTDLEAALKAAQRAVELAPENGFAWTRLGEMQFSFGRTKLAREAAERALALTPRNAQAHALHGFLLSAENRIDAARAAFEEAIRCDSGLGNAWLGRGLTSLRHGDSTAGRRDLQTAATLEPTRSLFHSYLGKAFSNEAGSMKGAIARYFGKGGQSTEELSQLANKDFARAKELDPDDPTPLLYEAIQRKQENRYNESVADLERSLALNDNRRIYRSRFLLDQDKGVRSSNLASIYQNDGMTEVAVREAVRAVNADYGSAAAHLFLANSYDALRDPRRVLLRYETPWFNEQLLANLLSPVGGGPLSQFVSAQEYSKMFEAEGFGLNVVSEYRSTGELRMIASQYGTKGNLSYALDASYQYDNGRRPNSDLSRFEAYATFKLQLTPQDSLFFQTKYQDSRTGDTLQRYDDAEVRRDHDALNKRFRQVQDPGAVIVGLHHEWSPGNHTILLGSWLRNSQTLNTLESQGFQVTRDIGGLIPAGTDPGTLPDDAALAREGLGARSQVLRTLRPLVGRGTIREQAYGNSTLPAVSTDHFDFRRTADFEIFSAELQQILTLDRHTLILGARFQSGEFDTTQQLSLTDPATRTSGFYTIPAADQHSVVDFQRFTLYAYENWKLTDWLTLHAGVTYDDMQYPENFRVPPISDRQKSLNRVSPKIGFTLSPSPLFTMRGVYTEFVSGVSFEESVRLEPTQIAGFAQAFRSTISEDVLGSIAGAKFRVAGLSIESRLPTRTYLGAEFNNVEQRLTRSRGVFDVLNDPSDPRFLGILPSQLDEEILYREQVLSFTINQLIGQRLSLGARYRIIHSHLEQGFPEISRKTYPGGAGDFSASLQEATVFANYNHPSGFFARAEATYYHQENHGYAPTHLSSDGMAGDSFWMVNSFIGYRFAQTRAEVSAGVLNIGDTDYRLNSLNPIEELPHERTFVMRCRFSF